MCQEEKSVDLFYSHKETKDRLRKECKSCWLKLAAKYHQENKLDRSTKAREYHYRNKYGISYREFILKLSEQNNKCAICAKQTKLVQDHCHKTQRLRKLLCSTCNQGLGSFYDNPTLLRNAAHYLETH